MFQSEAKSIIENVLTPLFSRWQPEAEEVESWARWLCPFEYDSTKQAIRQAASETNHYAPPRKLILSRCREYKSKQRRKRDEIKNNYGYVNVFVQYRGGSKTKLLSGYFQQLCFGQDKLIPAPDLVLRAAERQRAEMAKAWGGEWVVKQGCASADMVKERAKMNISETSRRKQNANIV